MLSKDYIYYIKHKIIMELSNKEKILIMNLRKNGREKIKSIAEKNNLPIATLAKLLIKMEKQGILKHKTKVSFDKLGFQVKMLIALKAQDYLRQKLQNYLLKNPNINNMYIINSDYDFCIEAIFKNHKDAKDFLENSDFTNLVLKKNVYDVIEVINDEKFLTDRDHFI